jgi:hypothetical protein
MAAPHRPGIIKPPDDLNRVCAGESDVDDHGAEFERCAENDHGHLYFHGWCVHCQSEQPE